MELLHGRGRLHAELVDQHAAQSLIDLQGLVAAAGAVQRHHEMGMEPLVERMLRHQHLQLTDQLAVAAQFQVGGDAQFQGAQPLLLHPGHVRGQDLARRHVGQRGPAPQRQCLAEPVRGAGGVALVEGRAALVRQPFEPQQVTAFRRDVQQIPGDPGVQRGRGTSIQHVLAEFVDVGLKGRHGAGKRLVPQSSSMSSPTCTSFPHRTSRKASTCRTFGAVGVSSIPPLATHSGPRIRKYMHLPRVLSSHHISMNCGPIRIITCEFSAESDTQAIAVRGAITLRPDAPLEIPHHPLYNFPPDRPAYRTARPLAVSDTLFGGSGRPICGNSGLCERRPHHSAPGALGARSKTTRTRFGPPPPGIWAPISGSRYSLRSQRRVMRTRLTAERDFPWSSSVRKNPELRPCDGPIKKRFKNYAS